MTVDEPKGSFTNGKIRFQKETTRLSLPTLCFQILTIKEESRDETKDCEEFTRAKIYLRDEVYVSL